MKKAELPKHRNDSKFSAALTYFNAWSRINWIVQGVMAHPGRILTTLEYIDADTGNNVQIFIIIGGVRTLRQRTLSSLWFMWEQGYRFRRCRQNYDANEDESVCRVYCSKVA